MYGPEKSQVPQCFTPIKTPNNKLNSLQHLLASLFITMFYTANTRPIFSKGHRGIFSGIFFDMDDEIRLKKIKNLIVSHLVGFP
jgi:hypothetical protein